MTVNGLKVSQPGVPARDGPRLASDPEESRSDQPRPPPLLSPRANHPRESCFGEIRHDLPDSNVHENMCTKGVIRDIAGKAAKRPGRQSRGDGRRGWFRVSSGFANIINTIICCSKLFYHCALQTVLQHGAV